MNGKRIALAVIAPFGLLTAYLPADEPKESAIHIAYLGIHDATIKRTGEAVTVAVFRMVNHTTDQVHFMLAGRKPDTIIQQKTDDGWKTAYWNWCGNGKRNATLEPSASRTWYVDPAYYSGKFGQHLRFGVWVGLPHADADNDRRTKPMIVWTDPIQFPKVDKPPQLEFSGALHRAATKNHASRPAPSVPSRRRRCMIRFR